MLEWLRKALNIAGLESRLAALESKPNEESLAPRLGTLEGLLDGVKRIVAPDGTIGIYIPFRVGIQTEWWLHQPLGKGATFGVATAGDPFTAVIQHDGDQIDVDRKVKGRRVALAIHNTDPNEWGENVGVFVVATTAPKGNIAIDAQAQYSPEADVKVTVIKAKEWKE